MDRQQGLPPTPDGIKAKYRKEIKMNLKNELKQLESYYEICGYNGKLKAESLIHGINCILEEKKEPLTFMIQQWKS